MDVQRLPCFGESREPCYPIYLSGTLYIVATPIGNLGDITARASKVLQDVALIACEDTRQTHKLLDHLGINKPMMSFHEHNERDRIPELLGRLTVGDSVALVSDAGTPSISDPGYRLIGAALASGLTVVPIPGACAAVAALSASGLPTDAFYFGGFLPVKQGPRRKALAEMKGLAATLIYYEAPHRVMETLRDLAEVCAERPVVLAREVTKMHEEFLRGKAAELLEILEKRGSIKGEFTILIGKGAPTETDDRPVAEVVAEMEASGVSRMEAMKAVAKRRGLSKAEVYRMVEESKGA